MPNWGFNRNKNSPKLIGQEAEERVKNIATRYGLQVETSLELDHASKTDILINGFPFQVSVQPKSRREMETLGRRGIHHISAGPQVSDDYIVGVIFDVINNQ